MVCMSDLLSGIIHNNKEQIRRGSNKTNANETQTIMNELNLDAIKDIALKFGELYKQQLDELGITASGNLGDAATNPNNLIVELNGEILTIYLRVPKYWRYVEYGRGPGGMPPIDNILKWLQVKKGIPSSKSGKVPDISRAYAIATNIAKHGTRARYPRKQMIESNEFNSITEEIRQEIVRQITQIVLES